MILDKSLLTALEHMHCSNFIQLLYKNIDQSFEKDYNENAPVTPV